MTSLHPLSISSAQPPKLSENQGLWRPNLCELWCFAAAVAAAAAATAAATAAFCFVVLQLLLCCCCRCCHCCRRRCCFVCCCWCWCYLFALLVCCCCCWLLAPAQNLPTATFRPPLSPQVSQSYMFLTFRKLHVWTASHRSSRSWAHGFQGGENTLNMERVKNKERHEQWTLIFPT